MKLNAVISVSSIGMALTDTLDDLISDERINPQLAMKILGNFDQAITEALQKNVKSRLSFKVNLHMKPTMLLFSPRSKGNAVVQSAFNLLLILCSYSVCEIRREASILIDSATKCGHSLSRMSPSKWTPETSR